MARNKFSSALFPSASGASHCLLLCDPAGGSPSLSSCEGTCPVPPGGVLTFCGRVLSPAHRVGTCPLGQADMLQVGHRWYPWCPWCWLSLGAAAVPCGVVRAAVALRCAGHQRYAGGGTSGTSPGLRGDQAGHSSGTGLGSGRCGPGTATHVQSCSSQCFLASTAPICLGSWHGTAQHGTAGQGAA